MIPERLERIDHNFSSPPPVANTMPMKPDAVPGTLADCTNSEVSLLKSLRRTLPGSRASFSVQARSRHPHRNESHSIQDQQS